MTEVGAKMKLSDTFKSNFPDVVSERVSITCIDVSGEGILTLTQNSLTGEYDCFRIMSMSVDLRNISTGLGSFFDGVAARDEKMSIVFIGYKDEIVGYCDRNGIQYCDTPRRGLVFVKKLTL